MNLRCVLLLLIIFTAFIQCSHQKHLNKKEEHLDWDKKTPWYYFQKNSIGLEEKQVEALVQELIWCRDTLDSKQLDSTIYGNGEYSRATPFYLCTFSYNEEELKRDSLILVKRIDWISKAIRLRLNGYQPLLFSANFVKETTYNYTRMYISRSSYCICLD